MGKISGLQIELSTNVYHPGETVQGKVSFNAVEDFQVTVIKIIFQGDAKVQWSEGGKYKTTYTNYEGYVYKEITLQQGSGKDSVTVQRGLHEFSFSFQLPLSLPSSFRVPEGRVKYVLKASIHRPWAIPESVVQDLCVRSLLDLNLIPEAMMSADADNDKTVCCWCCATGPITASLHIDRTGYVPGETITVKGGCENRSTRNCNAQLKVIMHTVCTGKTCCSSKQKTFDSVVAKHNLSNITAKGRQRIDGESFVLPPLPPSGLEYCSIMSNSYTLQYIIDPGPSMNLRVPLNLIVGSIPLTASSPPETTTLNPIVHNSALSANTSSSSVVEEQTSNTTE